ncbi:hypothetical protein N9P82_00015 [bacterium]|nr:hypothetical protein [bacterium]
MPLGRITSTATWLLSRRGRTRHQTLRRRRAGARVRLVLLPPRQPFVGQAIGGS